MRRSRYQQGSVVRKARKLGPDVWVFRYVEDGRRLSVPIGTVEKYKTKGAATKASEYLRIKANPDQLSTREATWGALLDRYLAEELPERHSSGKSYKSRIKVWVRPKWGEYHLSAVKTFAIEQWLDGLKLEPKTKGHIKNVMTVTYNCAIRWEMVDSRIPNPLTLVRVPGVSKRKSIPLVITADDFGLLVESVSLEPFKTMLLVCGCLGLRSCELVGLKWSDFDFDGMTVFIQRGVVEGREGEVKTVYSHKMLPLAEKLAQKLQCWRLQATWREDSDWVFASPYHDGTTPYWPKSAMNYHVMPAAKAAKIAIKGWHTFRHTYSTLLRSLGIDIKVQQELLRHADIRTTMDGYTQGVAGQLREANALLVNRLVN